MEFRNLVTFTRVAELHSFSQAAREMGYSQSAVSTQIAQLEEELGVPLFDRIGRTVSLTMQGQTFLAHAQEILRMTENARNEIKSLPIESGELRIAMAESISISLFPQILTEFCARYPQVRVNIRTGDTNDMFRMLQHNEVDFIYTLDRRIAQSDMILILDKPEPVCFVASPEHALAQKLAANPTLTFQLKELISYSFILTEKRMSYRELLDQHLTAHKWELVPQLEIGNTNLIKQLVRQNMGLAFLPHFTVREDIENGSLIQLPVTDCPVKIWRQLIHHKSKWVTPAMQAMFTIIDQSY